jgi:hypothetical protein
VSDLPKGCQADVGSWRGYTNYSCKRCNVYTLEDNVWRAACQALSPRERNLSAARATGDASIRTHDDAQRDDGGAHDPELMTAAVADDPNTGAPEPPEPVGGGWYEIKAGPRKGERVQGEDAAIEATNEGRTN